MSLNHLQAGRLFFGILAVGLSVSALGQSVQFPTYQAGPQPDGSFIAGSGVILTPAGTTVNLGIRTRAKAVALNPTGNHTAAVLQMGAPQVVTVFNTKTGAVLQNFTPKVGAGGSSVGITYTSDGKYLLFSQDGGYGPSYVAVASAQADGTLASYAAVSVPPDVDANGKLLNANCYPYDESKKKPSGSPPGTNGSFEIPCGYSVSLWGNQAPTSYPMGIAVSPDNKTGYVVLDNNNTLAKIDLTAPAASIKEGAELTVGNIPHSVVLSADGKTAYVSNEGGWRPNKNSFQEYSNGFPVRANYPVGSMDKGTISVVDTENWKVTRTIGVGYHPTGMALYGTKLLVANAYEDSISVIDTATNTQEGKIDLGLPLSLPGEKNSAYGAGPNSIAVDAAKKIAYVALYNANAIAVIDLNNWNGSAVLGMIPVGYAPSSVVLDSADGSLLVANDKGWGTTGNPNPFQGTVTGAPTTANSTGKYYGAVGLNTHQDLGTVSIVPIPSSSDLGVMTHQVKVNNHWDLWENIESAGGGDKDSKPVVIPRKIGDPSKIKHVFVIIRENRTYDQILGDVVGGNGDSSLATFGDNSSFTQYPHVTPNAHALVKRFPLLDNFYDPSRQSADGHNWIVQAMAPYSDDVQSPDWLRDYPSNGGDAIAYQTKGFLWDAAAKAGVSVKNYGEYVEYNTFNVPGCKLNNIYTAYTSPGGAVAGTVPLPFKNSISCEPLWIDFYNDVQAYESGQESQLYNYNFIASATPLPNLYKVTVQNYPQFDLNIPDQYRFDVWQQDFNRDVAAGKVPQLEFMWISSDHTGGPPNAAAMQADNDLALGRFVDAISHSPIWKDSVIFVEEDDSQNGVDHVDGHRSPGYVISPYVKQQVNSDGTGTEAVADSTFYTQVSMTRTIEQILGITPMNQNDLVASPMKDLFVENPPVKNFLPWAHVPAGVPLNYGVTQTPTETAIPGATASSSPVVYPNMTPTAKALMVGWMKKKSQVFAGNYHKPDVEDTDTVNHMVWYEMTAYKVPYPGEKKVRPASDFRRKKAANADLDD
ncbi:alkaline phosphatase family protein [Occallatibacter savannae]|uniref:alkaline phosphatase family protein n=1 Tax=Occallatibacter savannae TaxID=1002691 RepID=UPI00194FB03D|nr:alkaline phosphatase family protein [Occallatibacter savannae]